MSRNSAFLPAAGASARHGTCRHADGVLRTLPDLTEAEDADVAGKKCGIGDIDFFRFVKE